MRTWIDLAQDRDYQSPCRCGLHKAWSLRIQLRDFFPEAHEWILNLEHEVDNTWQVDSAKRRQGGEMMYLHLRMDSHAPGAPAGEWGALWQQPSQGQWARRRKEVIRNNIAQLPDLLTIKRLPPLPNPHPTRKHFYFETFSKIPPFLTF